MKRPPNTESGHGDEWPVAPEPGPPPGPAIVAYRRARIVNRFGRRVAELEFEIVEPAEFLKAKVIMYCALPLDGPARPSGKYFENWVMANGAPPNRRDRLSPGVFRGYWAAALVRSQIGDEQDGETKIGRLVERVSGGPIGGANE